MSKKPNRPRDPNQLAKRIADIATGDHIDDRSDGKSSASVKSGRLGGLKGGKARADSLTPERRQEIARIAALKRWGKDGKGTER